MISGTSDHGLPELLRLSDDIWLQVFTHRSFFARPTHLFEDLLETVSADNETLEHLGDAVLSLVVTQLIQERWPRLRVGPATKVRSRVVGNPALAEISRKYDLPRWLRSHAAQSIALRSSLKVQADLFEAYLGGMYLDKGFETVKWWLTQVMIPLVEDAYQRIREEHGLTPLDNADHPVHDTQYSQATVVYPFDTQNSTHGSSIAGHLSLLNQYCQHGNRSVEWKYCDVPEGTKTTPIWSVDAFVDGEFVGSGRGNTKKAARNDAAKHGLKFLGVVVP